MGFDADRPKRVGFTDVEENAAVGSRGSIDRPTPFEVRATVGEGFLGDEIAFPLRGGSDRAIGSRSERVRRGFDVAEKEIPAGEIAAIEQRHGFWRRLVDRRRGKGGKSKTDQQSESKEAGFHRLGKQRAWSARPKSGKRRG